MVTSVAWAVAGALWVGEMRSGGQPPVRPANLAAPAEQEFLLARDFSDQAGPRLLIPVAGVTIGDLVDTFTQARDGGARPHDAIDIPAPFGTPVVAAAPGVVEKLHLSKQGGVTVYLRSPSRTLIYYYAHLDRYAPGLAEGQALAAGAPIGFIGWSGNADAAAPHLHFAILHTAPQKGWWEPARAINPYPLLTAR